MKKLAVIFIAVVALMMAASVNSSAQRTIEIDKRYPTAPGDYTVRRCRSSENYVAIWAVENYKGRCEVFTFGEHPNVQLYTPATNNNVLIDDTMRSIQVGRDVKALVCSEINFKGKCELIAGDHPNLSDLKLIKNDEASSIKVFSSSVPDEEILRGVPASSPDSGGKTNTPDNVTRTRGGSDTPDNVTRTRGGSENSQTPVRGGNPTNTSGKDTTNTAMPKATQPSNSPRACPNGNNFITNDDVAEILRAHNQTRDLVGLPPLKWNCDLAGFAQGWANTDVWQHSTNASRATIIPGIQAGENLSINSDQNSSFAELIQGWIDERNYYNISRNTCAKEPCGHYTQMVWRTTTEVGCAINLQSNAKYREWRSKAAYFVCNYSPAGNYVGVKPY